MVALLSPLNSGALDMAHTPPRTRGEIKKNLLIAATERSAPRFREIIEANLDREERSGLIVIGVAVDHEVDSARKFARLLKAELGLRVVLLSSWGIGSVPAFDGVVIDGENNIVANFSMKKVTSPHIDKLWSSARNAFEKIRRFSELDSWISVMLNQVGPGDDEGILVDTAHKAEVLHRAYHEVADEVSIFKIGSDRPNWVFVDSDSAYGLDDVDAYYFSEAIPPHIMGDERKAVILHSRGRFYTYGGGRMSADSVGCEYSLSSGRPKG